MRILSVRHPSPLNHVPHGARKARLSFVTRTTPVELAEVVPGSLEEIGEISRIGVRYLSLDGGLWEAHAGEGGPIGEAAVREWLETWPRPRMGKGHPIPRMFAHTPFAPVASVSVSDLPKLGIDGVHVREDLGELASGWVAEYARSNLRHCEGQVLVRSRGPLLRIRGKAHDILYYPQDAWADNPYERIAQAPFGHACRIDRFRSLWAFHCRRAGNDDPLPELPKWMLDFPSHLSGEQDAVLYANRLAVWTDCTAEEFGRRLSLHGFAAVMRAARGDMADIAIKGMFGALTLEEVPDALRRCAFVLEQVHAGWRQRRDRAEGWERSLKGHAAINHADFVRTVLLPRLDAVPPPEGDDALALEGIGLD